MSKNGHFHEKLLLYLFLDKIIAKGSILDNLIDFLIPLDNPKNGFNLQDPSTGL